MSIGKSIITFLEIFSLKKIKINKWKNRENIIDIGIKKNLDYLIFDDGLQDKKIFMA